MSDLREAAQQALEALDKLYLPGELERVNAAITALRAALAQQDEPVQEPVAWMRPDNRVAEESYSRTQFSRGRDKPPIGTWRPLYTAPPRCPNCASLEAQNTELDRKLAELEQAYENGYKAGVAAEREACAKACERYELARSAAAAIRARGNT